MEEGGEQGGFGRARRRIQGAPLIIITAARQSRSAGAHSARQPNQEAHLPLSSLSNEPVIGINVPPLGSHFLMASLITPSDGGGMKMKRWGKWGRLGLDESVKFS